MATMPLLDAAALRSLVDSSNPVLLDVRWSLAGGADRAAYRAGHLDGAVFVDVDADICGHPGHGGRHPLPAPDALQERLRSFGIDNDSTIVVYDDGDMLAASRTWWTLRWAGLSDVYVIDGGVNAWDGEMTTRTPDVRRGTVTVRPGSLPVLDAAGAAALAETGQLLDVRAAARYRGETEPIDPVAGHIPGAGNAPGEALLAGGGGFVDRDRLHAELGGQPAHTGLYCGSGITASRTALAMHAIGRPVPPVYIGSWSDWVHDPSRPIATDGP